MRTTIEKHRSTKCPNMWPASFQRASILALMMGVLSWANVSQASVLDIRFDQDQRYVMKEMLGPGKSLELCGLLINQNQIAWRFESDAKLDFNIHFHVGDAVHYPTKLKQKKKASDRLDVAQEQTYCWMWTNRATKGANLTANLEKLK